MARSKRKLRREQNRLRTEVEEAARGRLGSCPYPAIKRLTCEFSGGSLVLRGRVASYFEKQVAQEAVAHLDGIADLVNVVEVS